MRTSILTAAAGAVVAIGAAGWWVTRDEAPGVTALDPAAIAQDAEAPEAGLVQEIVLGEADAPLTVVEYASFTCPHCARFHEEVFPALQEEYIDTGKVRFEYREVYFDRYGLWAGMLARCGDGMRYMGIADIIYEEQSEWTDGTPAQVAENLRRIGVRAGLDAEQVEACLSDGEMAEALVATYEANAARDGVRATPSFLIDGEMTANMSLADFRETLDAALDE